MSNIRNIGLIRGINYNEIIKWNNKKMDNRNENKLVEECIIDVINNQEITIHFVIIYNIQNDNIEISIKILSYFLYLVQFIPGIILFVVISIKYPRKDAFLCLQELYKTLIDKYGIILQNYSISFVKKTKELRELFYLHYLKFNDYQNFDRFSDLLTKVDKIKTITTDNVCTIIRHYNMLEIDDLKSTKLYETSKIYEKNAMKIGKKYKYTYSKKVIKFIYYIDQYYSNNIYCFINVIFFDNSNIIVLF